MVKKTKKTMTRRDLIKGAAFAAASLGLAKTPLLAAVRSAAGGAGGRAAALLTGDPILVVVNLLGGNDGLNTLVPIRPADYARYRQLRPTLRYDDSDLLTLAGEPDYGLNPQMTAFQSLFAAGKLAIINGVGVPEDGPGLFNHAAGQFQYQSCDLDPSVVNGQPTGWIGRWLDDVPLGAISPGIDMGGGRLMLTGSQRLPISINRLKDFRLKVTTFDQTSRRAAYSTVMGHPCPEAGVAEANREYRTQALTQSQTIIDATATYASTVTYPSSWLGTQLQECAKILYGNVGVRAVAIGSNGFDTHGGQNQAQGQNLGDHDSLLKNVSDSIGAFYQDLAAQGLSDRVLILTITEFGRRAYENSDKGTDHGLSTVAFAVGDMVHGGLYGLYPSLTNLYDGSLRPTTDFRSVYATAIGGWLGADPVPVLGGSFTPVPYI